MSGLDDAIRWYEKVLDVALEAADGGVSRLATDEAEAKVRDVLVARDQIAHALAPEQEINSERLKQITRLDRILKERLKTITGMVRPSAFHDWRGVLQPPETSWWWFLDRLSAEPEPIPVWTILSILFAVLAVSLILDTTSLVFGGGLDFIKVFGTLAQVLVALLGASAFTDIGRKWIERIFFKTGFNLKSVNAWRAMLAFGALVLSLVMWWLIPPVAARFYNNRGYDFQRGGLSSRAIDYYQRAIALKADYVEAHFNLASAYEDATDYDKAIDEYRRTIALDENFYRAYNNLARLCISQRKDFASALNYLKTALDHNPQEPSVRYSLFKNRGWANLGLQSYIQAEQDLREALNLASDPRAMHYGAAAHCLLAQVLKAQQNRDQSATLSECEACVAYASDPDTKDIIDATWLNFAQQCLREGEHK